MQKFFVCLILASLAVMIVVLSCVAYECSTRGESTSVLIGGACFYLGIFATVVFIVLSEKWGWVISKVKCFEKITLRVQAAILVATLFIFLLLIINPIWGHRVETTLVICLIIGSLFYFPAMNFWHGKRVEVKA